MIRLLVLLIALACGAGAGLVGWRFVSAEDAAAAASSPPPAPAPDILVMARDVPAGAALASADLVWRPWPEEAVSPAYVARAKRPKAADEIGGTVARVRLVAGEPLIEAKLAPQGASFLASVLKEGERAVAVRVSAENSAGGFILPGDRVDVLHTRVGSGAPATSRAIIRDVEVLAIDQTADDETKGAIIGRTATLRVTPGQAERLVAGEATGKLSLALRALSDHGADEEIEEEATFEVEAAAVAAEPEPRDDTVSVRVRRGGVAQTVVVR